MTIFAVEVKQGFNRNCLSMKTNDIQPLSKTKFEVYSSLQSSKMRSKRKLFVAEGEKSVRDLIGSFSLEALIVSERIEAIPVWVASLSADQMQLIRYATDSQIKQLSSLTTPPEMIGVFKMPAGDEVIPEIKADELYLLLDGVRDPGNFGSIIRTADWFGVHTIFASADSADIFNPKVVQATMGSLRNVAVCYTDLKKLISSYSDMAVMGTLLEGENIYEAKLPLGGFLVMGNEGKGITESMKSMLTRALTIPPGNERHGESLNVAAATAVCLAELNRKRNLGN